MMFLELDKVPVPMKLVYNLEEDLRNDPERVALTQALTQDASRPFMGLKGTHGLFGSAQWWENVRQGVAPRRHVSGQIGRIFHAGQDGDRRPNAFDLTLPDGSVVMESFYALRKDDEALFQVGARVEILYVLEDLKASAADGNRRVSPVVLEMAVSQSRVD